MKVFRDIKKVLSAQICQRTYPVKHCLDQHQDLAVQFGFLQSDDASHIFDQNSPNQIDNGKTMLFK